MCGGAFEVGKKDTDQVRLWGKGYPYTVFSTSGLRLWYDSVLWKLETPEGISSPMAALLSGDSPSLSVPMNYSRLHCFAVLPLLAAALLAEPGAGAEPSGSSGGKTGKTGRAPKAVSKTKDGFTQTLSLQGITFKVSCPNMGSLNQVTIAPSGLSGDNSPIKEEVDGVVTGAEMADLNSDGYPELYIFTQSAGSGSYGAVTAYASNKKKSIGPVTFPDLADNAKAFAGYTGHDEFAVVEGRLVRRFPVDPKKNSGKSMRQIQYRLESGEASWILRVDRIVHF